MVRDDPAPTIAVINSSEDIVELLRDVLESEGFHVLIAHIPDIKRGRTDLIEFFERENPRVVVYDIAPPYLEWPRTASP